MALSSRLAARAFTDARLSVQAHRTAAALLPRPVREPAVSRLVLDLRDARDRDERRLTLV